MIMQYKRIHKVTIVYVHLNVIFNVLMGDLFQINHTLFSDMNMSEPVISSAGL